MTLSLGALSLAVCFSRASRNWSKVILAVFSFLAMVGGSVCILFSGCLVGSGASSNVLKTMDSYRQFARQMFTAADLACKKGGCKLGASQSPDGNGVTVEVTFPGLRYQISRDGTVTQHPVSAGQEPSTLDRF
ncbi:MAG: hypothetical protein M1383_06025 [Patescibacteria group bacterium]|nr:hypothetical protein [Patescibacteria group bacterium]